MRDWGARGIVALEPHPRPLSCRQKAMTGEGRCGQGGPVTDQPLSLTLTLETVTPLFLGEAEGK